MGGEQEEEPDEGAAERGAPPVVSATGEVHGSGSGAGGGGAPEEIDSDSAGGAGSTLTPKVTGQPNTGGDASNHGSR